MDGNASAIKMDPSKNICRICLGEIKEGYPLFETYEDQMTLASILNDFISDTTNLVLQKEGLPDLVCESCTEILVQFYNFMLIFKASAETLREGLTNRIEIKDIVEKKCEPPNEIVDDIERQLQQLEGSMTEEDVTPDIKNVEMKNAKIVTPILETAELIDNQPTVKKIADCQPIVKRVDVGVKKTEIEAANKNVIVKIDCVDSFDIKPLPFTCRLCHKGFAGKAKMLQHKRTCKATAAQISKTCICHQCGKICSKESDLKDHLDSHSTELKYSCKRCGKKLKSRTSLIRHLKAHTFKHQYMCELCGRKFTHLSTLRTHHSLLHVRDKKYHCIMCKMSFTLKASLQKHLYRHKQRESESVKKFCCDQCDMKYLDKSSLIRHIQVKHSENKEDIKCDLCEKSFASKNNMLRHKKTSHINVVVIQEVFVKE